MRDAKGREIQIWDRVKNLSSGRTGIITGIGPLYAKVSCDDGGMSAAWLPENVEKILGSATFTQGEASMGSASAVRRPYNVYIFNTEEGQLKTLRHQSVQITDTPENAKIAGALEAEVKAEELSGVQILASLIVG